MEAWAEGLRVLGLLILEENQHQVWWPGVISIREAQTHVERPHEVLEVEREEGAISVRPHGVGWAVLENGLGETSADRIQ